MFLSGTGHAVLVFIFGYEYTEARRSARPDDAQFRCALPQFAVVGLLFVAIYSPMLSIMQNL